MRNLLTLALFWGTLSSPYVTAAEGSISKEDLIQNVDDVVSHYLEIKCELSQFLGEFDIHFFEEIVEEIDAFKKVRSLSSDAKLTSADIDYVVGALNTPDKLCQLKKLGELTRSFRKANFSYEIDHLLEVFLELPETFSLTDSFLWKKLDTLRSYKGDARMLEKKVKNFEGAIQSTISVLASPGGLYFNASSAEACTDQEIERVLDYINFSHLKKIHGLGSCHLI